MKAQWPCWDSNGVWNQDFYLIFSRTKVSHQSAGWHYTVLLQDLLSSNSHVQCSIRNVERCFTNLSVTFNQIVGFIAAGLVQLLEFRSYCKILYYESRTFGKRMSHVFLLLFFTQTKQLINQPKKKKKIKAKVKLMQTKLKKERKGFRLCWKNVTLLVVYLLSFSPSPGTFDLSASGANWKEADWNPVIIKNTYDWSSTTSMKQISKVNLSDPPETHVFIPNVRSWARLILALVFQDADFWLHCLLKFLTVGWENLE